MSDEMVRDEELGAALRALAVPEHRDGFWNVALGAGDQVATSGPRRYRALLAIAAAVVVVAGLAAVFARDDEDGRTGVVAGPPPSTVMVTGVLAAELHSGERVQAFEQRFAVAVDGSSSFVLTDGKGGQTFDARTRKWSMSSEEGSGRGIGWFLRENAEPQLVSLSTMVGGLPLTVEPIDSEATTFLGRAAHRSTVTGALRVFGNRNEADHIEIVVDDETGILLRYEASLRGEPAAKMEVRELTPLRSIDRSPFEVTVPAGEPVIRTSDDGVRLVDLDGLDDVVGYAVDAPSEVDGFTLDSVAARPGMPGSQSSAANPLDRDRVQLLYRRGWNGFEVVIQRSATYPTTTVPHAPMPESTTTIGAFTVTVRGDLDASQRAEVLDRIRPRD